MSDARERMARAICCPKGCRPIPMQVGCQSCAFRGEADAALAVARELVKQADATEPVGFQASWGDAMRAALRALGETE